MQEKVEVPKKKRFLFLGCGAAVLCGLGAGLGITLSSGGSPHGGATTIPAYCTLRPAGSSLTACLESHAQGLKAAEADWPVSGSILPMTAAIADAIANQHLTSFPQASGVASANASSASSTSAPAATLAPLHNYAYQTTYGAAGSLMEATNPEVTPATPVWIVTTEWNGALPQVIPVLPPGSARDTTPTTFSTVVIDAVSGKTIDGCQGCNIVQSDGKLVKTPTVQG